MLPQPASSRSNAAKVRSIAPAAILPLGWPFGRRGIPGFQLRLSPLQIGAQRLFEPLLPGGFRAMLLFGVAAAHDGPRLSPRPDI